VELPFGCADSRLPRESVENRFSRSPLRLLREVADRQQLRDTRDGSGVRLFETREQTQKRRLADAVRADDPDPSARTHGECDLIDDRVCTEMLRDAGETNPQDGTS
jgi:hypothetical protein